MKDHHLWEKSMLGKYCKNKKIIMFYIYIIWSFSFIIYFMFVLHALLYNYYILICILYVFLLYFHIIWFWICVITFLFSFFAQICYSVKFLLSKKYSYFNHSKFLCYTKIDCMRTLIWLNGWNSCSEMDQKLAALNFLGKHAWWRPLLSRCTTL